MCILFLMSVRAFSVYLCKFKCMCLCVCVCVYLCMRIGICHETRKETMKEEKEILRKTMEY